MCAMDSSGRINGPMGYRVSVRSPVRAVNRPVLSSSIGLGIRKAQMHLWHDMIQGALISLSRYRTGIFMSVG